jgi:hypothetical protein
MPEAIDPRDFDTSEEWIAAVQARNLRLEKQTFWEALQPNTCWSCAFVGYRTRETQEPLTILDADMRQSGMLPEGKDLWCFQERTHLPREVDESEETFDQRTKFYNNMLSKRSAAVREVLDKDRPRCAELEKWFRYRDGLSIKEHYDEWQTMQLEDLRRKQSEMVLAQTLALTAFQEKQLAVAELINQTVADQATLAASGNLQARRFNWLFAGLAVGSIIVGVAAVVFQIPWVIDRIDGDRAPVVVVTPTPQTPDTSAEP